MSTPPIGAHQAPDGMQASQISAELFQQTLVECNMHAADASSVEHQPFPAYPAPQLGAYERAHADLAMHGAAPGVATPLAGGGPAGAPASEAHPRAPWADVLQGSPLLQLLAQAAAQAAANSDSAAAGGQYLWPKTPTKDQASAAIPPAAWQPASPTPLTLAPLPPLPPFTAAVEPLPQDTFSGAFAAGLPGLSYHDGTPLRHRRKARSKARILKPGELTLIVYGADEATRWEERVAGFLAAVRGVLGCRQLEAAQWRCSILDSVVGAFLTQNVTDALSSKAFMTLAARFPAPPLAAAAGEAGPAAAGDARLTCQDSINWQAVLRADPEQVADAIKCRGMYNFLARRIQGLLSLIGRDGRPTPRPRPLPPAPVLRQLPGPAQSGSQRQAPAASGAGSSPEAGSPTAQAGALQEGAAAAGAEAVEGPPAAPASPRAGAASSPQDSASPLQPETPRQAGGQPRARPASAEPGSAQSPVRAAAACSGGEGCQTPPPPKQLKSDELRRSLYRKLGSAPDGPSEPIAAPQKAPAAAARALQPAAGAGGLPGGAVALPAADAAAAAGGGRGTSFPLELEWLWGTEPDEAREHLMGIEGLGRKSAACILLLALRKKDFPVDTNVGRICARLGWLPLDAEKALEDLDDYAPEPEVHAYLKDRLMRFDVPMLYELHYHMITLGKVFCSKRDPNCSACPLQRQCQYARSNGRKRQPAAAPAGADQARHAASPAGAAQQLQLPGAEAAAAAGAGPSASPAAGAVPSQRLLPAAQQGAQPGAEGLRAEAAASAAAGMQPSWDGAASPLAQLGSSSAATPAAAAAAQLPAAAPRGPSSAAQEQPAEPEGGVQDVEDLCSQPKAGAAAAALLRLLDAAAPLRELTSAPDQGQSTARAVEAAQQAMGLAAGASGAGARAQAGPSAAAARKRFLELSALTHPDKCSHPRAEEAFAALKLAYSLLQDHLASQAPVGRGADGLFDAKALRSVTLRDASTRLAVEAWEVPAAEGPRLVGGLADGALASDHPFLLIYIPAGTVLPPPDGAAQPQVAGASQALPAAAEGPKQPADAARRPAASEAAAPVAAAGPTEGLDREEPPQAAGPASSPQPGIASSAREAAAASSAAGGAPAAVGSAQPAAEEPQPPGAQAASQQARAEDAAASSGEGPGQAPPAPRVGEGHFALLVPCRLAMRGRFPLHGTYFQTNEVFLDHSSLCGPGVKVAEEEVAGWPQRQVLFGSSVGSICRGMSQLEVACVFRRACICVRAYEPASGLPRALPACLHPRGYEPKAAPPKWRPKPKRSLAAIAASWGPSFRVPSFRTTAGGKRVRDDGLVLWGAARLRTALVGKRPLPPSPEEAAARKRRRLEQGLRMGGPRPGSTLPSGIRHLLPPAMASQDARALEALLRSKAGPDDGRRRHLLPNVGSSQRCGHCKSCLNRAMKKACYTRRAELLQSLMAESSGAAAAEAAQQAAEPATVAA